MALVEGISEKIVQRYCEQPRKGDHVCYVSNLRKLKSHYPAWQVTRDLPAILEEMVVVERRQKQGIKTV